MDFAFPTENKRKQKDRKILRPCQITKEDGELEDEGNTNCWEVPEAK